LASGSHTDRSTAGSEADVKARQLDGLRTLGLILGNSELVEQVEHVQVLPQVPLDRSNVCSRLSRKIADRLPWPAEAKFVALRFGELDAADLRRLGAEVLDVVLSLEGRDSANEGFLLQFLLDSGPEDAALLMRHLRAQYLSREAIAAFEARFTKPVDPGLASAMWVAIRDRLVVTTPRRELNCPMQDASKIQTGIISHLTREHGGNVHEQGIVTITSKSVADGHPAPTPQRVADLASGESFRSDNVKGQWICWDFRDSRVRVTHYTIGAIALLSWIVEGSMDGWNWTELDRQQVRWDWDAGIAPDVFFDTGYITAAISTVARVRFIRLTQMAMNANGDDHLTVDSVEFFGTLLE
jgi:hypothetical protein